MEVENCTKGGCSRYKTDTDCKECSFDKREAAYRRLLPMKKGKDGLWRKVAVKHG